MLRLKDPSAHYGKGYIYRCPKTKEVVVCSNWSGFFYKVKEHFRRHRFEIPVDFAGITEHNWCVEHPEMCFDPENLPAPTPKAKIPYPNLATQFKSFLADTAEWARSGFKRSDRELVEKRLTICINCEYWSGAKSFWDYRCRKCGCRLRLKVAMPKTRCPIGRW